jgi:glycosyltransferase involved in cell wall biosynthesis
VTTNHGPFSAPELADVYRRTAHRVPVIAISEDQAAAAGPAGIAVAATIHHGLDLDAYRYNPHSGDYVAVLGRMHPDKGIDRAITLAREAGVKVKVAAKMREPAEHAYYQDMIKPLLGGPGVEYIGEVGHDAKIELLSGARALLNPVRWPEPFGLVNVEALACGTPVVATDRGALPELVAHGETGYIAASDTGLVEALDKIDCIDRSVCRHQAETRFSMQRMAADHETLYRQVIAAWPTGGHQARERR